MTVILLVTLSAVLVENLIEAKIETVPPYVKQCHEGDPKLIECLIGALHHLQPYLANGIPEIELPPVEPFKMDELSLSLTSGPNGYKVRLVDIDVFGASNYSVTKLRLSHKGKPFEAEIRMPALTLNSRYQSSGVLIIIPASGNGTFHGRFQNVKAIVRGTVSFNTKDNQRYLHVDDLVVNIDIGHVEVSVKDVYRNNRIIGEAMNLFLRENGQEVVKAMLPQLRKQLSNLFKSIANQLLTHIPLELFYTQKKKE